MSVSPVRFSNSNGCSGLMKTDTSIGNYGSSRNRAGKFHVVHGAGSFVEAMGGVIGVERKLGLGSTFWIDMPKIYRGNAD